MTKDIFWEITDWLLINLIAPLCVPYLFVMFGNLITKENMTYEEIFIKLLDNGVYTFIGIMLLISLFQEYRAVKEAFTFFFYASFAITFFGIGLIFISSLGIYTGEDAVTFQDNKETFMYFTFYNVASSIFFKYQLLKKKHQKDNI